MRYLVTKVRKDIGDTANLKHFTDDEIEYALDVRRLDISYAPLQAREYRTPTALLYKKFYSEQTPG